MFKSQASLKSLPSSLKSQYKQIKQVKSVAHLKQVKSTPDKGQVKWSHSIKQKQIYYLLIHFSSEINFFNYTF